MSYGEDVPPLSFEGMDVVCLSGPNGHGKSALLDAMTWALWGKSRASSDDELIRHGRTAMLVDFEFALEGQRYRVRRERVRRGKRGHSELEFFVWDESRGEWRALSENSIRQTQRRIIETLKLDYETFVNSAYLRQGRADEFTTKSPGQRKRILAEILRLDVYDELERRARERMRAAEQRIAEMKGRLQLMEEEIAQEPTLLAQLQGLEEQLRELAAQRAQAEALERELQTKVEHLRAREQDVQRQRERVKRLEQDIADLERELQALNRQKEAILDILNREAEIRERYTALQQARQENEAFNALLQRQVTLQKEFQEITEAWHRAQRDVERTLARLRQQRESLQAQLTQEEAVRQELQQAEEALALLEEIQQRIQDAREQQDIIRDEGTQAKSHLEHLEREIRALEERIERLQSARGEATCPLCGQPLSEEHLNQLLTQLREELEAKRREQEATRQQLEELRRKYREQAQHVQDLEQQRRQGDRTHQMYARATERLKQIEAAKASLQEVEQAIREEEERLAQGTFAADVKARRDALRQQLAELGYDEAKHTQVREQLQTLADAEEAYRTLQQARVQLQHVEQQIERLSSQHAQRKEILEQERAELARLLEEITALPDLQRQLREQSSQVDQLSIQERQLQAHVGGIKQQLAAIEEQKKRIKDIRKALRQEEEARTIYQQLAQAFGKNGLQAMIIEAVIPEIEERANALLGRMTNGRMSIRLKTQREKKTGGTAETLDIEIADENGVRPYELYSGGEAFRINFALRVALSKLLARRAGASLRSLFIDEGFGSQDGEGRMRLIDAINAIREDFDLIVVITHIEELKAAFPVRIEVQKGPAGSTFAIVV